MLWRSVFFILAAFTNSASAYPYTARIEDSFSLDWLQASYSCQTSGGDSIAYLSVDTKREIIGVSMQFYTIYDKPAEWYFVVDITGIKDFDKRTATSQFTSRFKGDVTIDRNILVYGYPDDNNHVFAMLEISPSIIQSGSFRYEEIPDEETQVFFHLSFQTQGLFPNPEIGRVFAIPESSSILFFLPLLFRRGRRA